MARLTLIFLILINLEARCDYVWTTNCVQAYEYTQKLNFKKTAALLEAERKSNPANMIPIYIESQVDFLKSFISENKSDLEGLKKRNDERIKKISSHTVKSPYQKLIIGELYMQLSIARIKAEEFFIAAYDIRKANKILEENAKLYPDFIPNLRGLGFIHAAAGSIPKNYQWAAGILGISGTISQGLSEIRLVFESSLRKNEYAYLRDETLVMLTFLEMTLGKQRDNNAIRKRFYNIPEIEHKPLLQFAKAVFHFANAENDSVITLLGNRETDREAFPLHYLNYMEGSARLYNMDFTAEQYFREYIKNYKGTSYVRSSWQRIAWIKLMKGDEEGYKTAISNCKSEHLEEAFTDEDKQAEKEAKSGEPPNLILLKARLLFDGGYYNRALKEIANKPVTLFPRQRDQLELTYRLARIFDKTDKKDQAISFYEQTYKNGNALSWHFAANSALMLGQLYEEKNQKKLASEWYKNALALRNHEYQNSIDQKAKSGLNRIAE